MSGTTESPARRGKEMKKGRSVPEMNNLEHVNAQLKGKLKILTIEMKDAVERMNSTTAEMNSIKNENLALKDRLAELEEENALLVSQIEEMANERAERDAIIEEFSSAVEARIVEWKGILDEKDTTIAKLKENLLCVSSSDKFHSANDKKKSDTNNNNNNNNNNNVNEIERLLSDIERRDEIIAELQEKLSEAVIEINESSLLIEKFKKSDVTRPRETSKRFSKEQRESIKKADDTSKRIITLESLLERAEKDAKVKSEQLCEALAILNKYEDEDSSLADALDQIKELHSQLEKKNKHVEDLVDVVNRLEEENSRYEEAIVILRDKIEEVTGEEEFSLENLILHRQKAQDEKDEETQRNYDQLSSENVDLKFQIRKLKNALKESLKRKLSKTKGASSDGDNRNNDNNNEDELSHRSDSQNDQLELHRIKKNVKWIIEENEALRQGMHEILDSIHNQDGKSIVTIQSQTLENLLDALDARHLAGWYHPAMRLQGRVNYLQGSNAELRAQLQQIRKNQLRYEAELLQRSSSVEEGECRQTLAKNSSELQITPKSSRSAHSLNADSGRASGKAAESDDLLQAITPDDGLLVESPGDTPMNDNDEAFGKKSEEIYAMAKEIVAQESDFKEALNAAEKRQRELEARIVTLRKNLANFVAPEVHAELRQNYLELSMRLRGAYEDRLAIDGAKDLAASQELRDELIGLHKQLVRLSVAKDETSAKSLSELECRITELELENEKLLRSWEIARDEAHKHRAIDSKVLAEFNELRRRVIRIETDSDDRDVKESARLALELANYKVNEVELREQKKTLERDLARAKNELDDTRRRKRRDSDGEVQGSDVGDGEYIEIIDFLQQQYAGSTSLSSYERYEAGLSELNDDRNEVKELIAKINEQRDNLKSQQETLTSRLQIVEQLKDMLEQQIGSNEVQDIMKRFTDETKKVLTESKYKAQISHLEEESRVTKKTLSQCEIRLAAMERESGMAQRAWQVRKESFVRRAVTVDKATETVEKIEGTRVGWEKFVQTDKLKVADVETQCANCCKTGAGSQSEMVERDGVRESSESKDSREDEFEDKAASISILQDQLGQALKLASERSIALSRSENQVVELRAKIASLIKLFDERQPLSSKILIETQATTKDGTRMTSQEALQSTINTLEKIIAQKETTIGRYQCLLKEDRDKHSEAAARLQEEIKGLRGRLGEYEERRGGTQQNDEDDL